MKFTKEQAVEVLTAKISAKDKDLDLKRTISESVDHALAIVGENEEMELLTFVDFVQPFVATAAGLAHKVGATATKTLQDEIAALKQANATKENEPPKEEPNNELKALLERLEKLEKENAENVKKSKVATKRSELFAAIEKLGVKDKDWVDAMLNEVAITEETDVEQKSKDYVALYNKTHAGGDSFTPKQTGGGIDEKIDLSGLDNALAQIRGNFGQGNNDK